MNDIPSKERTHAILLNWRYWSQDDSPDPATVNYYTISPMFNGLPFTRGSTPPYDADAALMVEEVLQVMFRPYPQERHILMRYYGQGYAQAEIAKELGINQSSVSKYRLPAARRIFAEQWGRMVRKTTGRFAS